MGWQRAASSPPAPCGQTCRGAWREDMDIFATSTTQNSPSHVAEKNKSSFLINFRRNVGFPVPYEQDGGGGTHNCNALQCWKLDPQLQGCSTVTHPLRCLMHNIRDRDLSKQSASLQACRCCTPRCKAQHLLLPPPGTNDAI